LLIFVISLAESARELRSQTSGSQADTELWVGGHLRGFWHCAARGASTHNPPLAPPITLHRANRPRTSPAGLVPPPRTPFRGGCLGSAKWTLFGTACGCAARGADAGELRISPTCPHLANLPAGFGLRRVRALQCWDCCRLPPFWRISRLDLARFRVLGRRDAHIGAAARAAPKSRGRSVFCTTEGVAPSQNCTIFGGLGTRSSIAGTCYPALSASAGYPSLLDLFPTSLTLPRVPPPSPQLPRRPPGCPLRRPQAVQDGSDD
jgi:hypothetical protein